MARTLALASTALGFACFLFLVALIVTLEPTTFNAYAGSLIASMFASLALIAVGGIKLAGGK